MRVEKKRREENGLRIEREREEEGRWRFGRRREEVAEEEKCAPMFIF
jgi:hypothetical protein